MIGPIRLSPSRRWAIYGSASGLWLSGGVWLIAHYFLLKHGEFGPETSPLEPWMLRLHGAFALVSLWFMGLLWGVHVVRGWQARRGRVTGGLLLGLLWTLSATGYLLYYLGDEDLRGLASLAHWLIGFVVLPTFLWHRFAPKHVPHGDRGKSA